MYQLNSQQLALLEQHYQAQQYVEAYKVITNSVSQEYNAYQWFDLAAGINANQGYASAYIRGYTVVAEALGDVIAGEDMTIISREQLQNASDSIAASVLLGIIENNGILPDESDIYRKDAQVAKDYLQLNDAEWGGIVPAAIGYINYQGDIPQGLENNTLMFISTIYASAYAGAAGTADAASSFIDKLSSMFGTEVNVDLDSSPFSDFFSDIFDNLSSLFGGDTSASENRHSVSVNRLVSAMSSFEVGNNSGSLIQQSIRDSLSPLLLDSSPAR